MRRGKAGLNTGLWFLATLLFYARFIEPHRLTFEEFSLADPEEDRLSIVHLSDLHLSKISGREENLIRKVNALEPDLVLVTGDLSQFFSGARGVQAVREFLTGLRPRTGTIAVLGDSDYSNRKDLCLFCHRERGGPLWEEPGLWILSSGMVNVNIRGTPVSIAAAGDPDGPSRGIIPEFSQPDGLRFLLLPDPDGFSHLPDRGVDLVLSGNTHGGQVRFPFLGAPVRTSRHGGRDQEGWVTEGENLMYINRGYGTSVLPFRLLCPPVLVRINYPLPPAPRASDWPVPE